MSINIQQVQNKRQLNQFIRFKHELYTGDENYVPQLDIAERIFLGKKNPFFEHSETAYFLGIQEQQIVGRIAAIHNKNHLKIHNDQSGFFGFFDCINDQVVATALLQAAAKWLHAKGLSKMIGPENFTTNDSAGILVEGFEQAPVVQMPYNKAYYEQLLLNANFQPVMDLYSYRFEQVDLPPTFINFSKKIEQRLKQQNIQIRPINFKHFKKEMRAMRPVYNRAMEAQWGNVPLTEKEFFFLANDLRQIVSKENVLFAEKDDQLIGYLVTVPDVNQIFAQIPKGKLLPFGWTKLVWKPKITGARMLILGILPEYRRLGIDWVFYAKMSQFYHQSGIQWTEACYVMEENDMMNRIINKLNGKKAKTYRLFETEIQKFINSKNEMNILIITGPPYSGKGTQCEILADSTGYQHISTGNRIRFEKEQDTPIGKQVKAFEEQGLLVPDDLMELVLTAIIKENEHHKGIILDGYPRTVNQVDTLLKIVQAHGKTIGQVINIEVSKEELLKRAKERAKKSNRKDDKDEQTHVKRIQVFEKETLPAIQYMKSILNVKNIDGIGSIQTITDRINQNIL